MVQIIEERKGMKKENKIKNSKDQIGGYQTWYPRQIKELRQILAWITNEIHSGKIKRKSTEKEKEILLKLEKWTYQQLNRNEELICVKEKAFDKLRYAM